jgi:hypothetical protein
MFNASRELVRKVAGSVVRRRNQQQQIRQMGSDMPVPQSQRAPLWHGHTVKHEGWEEYIYFYYFAGFFLQAAVLLGAPETRIESWARPEAQARLYLASEEGGGHTEFAFGTHYQDLIKKERVELWEKFNDKSINPGEDDDDDDDEEEDEDGDEEEEVRLRERLRTEVARDLLRIHSILSLLL